MAQERVRVTEAEQGPRPPRSGPATTWTSDATALWECWFATKDASMRQSLVEHYVQFAASIATRLFARRPNEGVEIDEYRQLALVGLIEAIDRFRPEQGATFTTFAFSRIRGAVLNGLESLTERLQQSAFRRRLEADRLESVAPEPLSRESTSELLERLGSIGVGIALGLILDGTGNAVAPEERLPEDAYARVEVRQLNQRLWALVRSLPERERDVIERHYGMAHPFEAIARDLELSKGRVSQLHRQAVQHLRALLKKAERCDVSF
jgi:RNA polymerase sigma factor FliA